MINSGAITLNPNNADAYDVLGFILACADEPSKGIKYIRKAFLLNPLPPSFYYQHLGICYRDLKEFDKAISAFKQSIRIQPENLLARTGLIPAYIYSGQENKAYELGLEVLKLDPNFSVEKYIEAAPLKTKDQITNYTQALLKAGLPE
jgi:tetratricopeptide (TPR) repeat protein